MNLYQKPPRNVPIMWQLSIIFGGTSMAASWIIFIMGCVLARVFGFLADPLVQPSRKHWETVQGVVKSVKYTGLAEDKKNTYKIISEYTYKGTGYQNISYEFESERKTGQAIRIEVNPHNPKESRAEGLRSRPYSPKGFLVGTLIIFIGLFAIIRIMWKTVKARNLLLNGEIATGILKARKTTDASYRGKENVIYIFEFEYMGKQYIAKYKTGLKKEIEDEEQEKILFKPTNPKQSIIYDALPLMPEVDAQGNMSFSSTYYGVLILPFMGIMLFVFLTLPVLLYHFGS